MNAEASEFLNPLWRRIALVAFCVAWFGWEIYNGDELWMAITGGLAAYGAWTYLIDYKPPAPARPKPGNDEDAS